MNPATNTRSHQVARKVWNTQSVLPNHTQRSSRPALLPACRGCSTYNSLPLINSHRQPCSPTPPPPPRLSFTSSDPCFPVKSPPPTSAQCLLTKPSGTKKDTTHSSSSLGHGDTDDDAASHQAEGHTGQLQAVEISGADGDVHAGLPRALLPGLRGVLVFLDECLLAGVPHPGWKLLDCKSPGCCLWDVSATLSHNSPRGLQPQLDLSTPVYSTSCEGL